MKRFIFGFAVAVSFFFVADSQAAISLISQSNWARVTIVDTGNLIWTPSSGYDDDSGQIHAESFAMALWHLDGSGTPGHVMFAMLRVISNIAYNAFGGEMNARWEMRADGGANGWDPSFSASIAGDFTTTFEVDRDQTVSWWGNGASLRNIATNQFIPDGDNIVLHAGTYELNENFSWTLTTSPGYRYESSINAAIVWTPEPSTIIIWLALGGMGLFLARFGRKPLTR
jgi:hypothetical protein